MSPPSTMRQPSRLGTREICDEASRAKPDPPTHTRPLRIWQHTSKRASSLNDGARRRGGVSRTPRKAPHCLIRLFIGRERECRLSNCWKKDSSSLLHYILCSRGGGGMGGPLVLGIYPAAAKNVFSLSSAGCARGRP